MGALDRITTIIVTATLTSAAWIVAGGTVLDGARGASQTGKVGPADVSPRPRPFFEAGTSTTQSLDTDDQIAPEPQVGAPLMVPVLGVRPGDLTDTFTQSREGGARLHEAIDIMAPEGTTIVSAHPGKVERLFLSEAGGNTIYVRSDDRRTIYYYAHLKDYAGGLREGQKVRRGQRLGSVGYTGNADPGAPHLHFAIMQTTPDAEWWEPSTPINPYPLLARR